MKDSEVKFQSSRVLGSVTAQTAARAEAATLMNEENCKSTFAVQRDASVSAERTISEKHRRINSQLVQTDGEKTQPTVSARKKTAARTKRWKLGTK